MTAEPAVTATGTVTVAEAVGTALAAAGVRAVFGVVGSGNFHVTNALTRAGARFIAARHEGGAAVMADAYARVSGELGVLSVHQGPGLTNALTGIAEAAKSRTPLLVLAAEATSPRSNFYIDQAALAAAVGAVPARVASAETAEADLARAYRMATAERRTVLLSLPLDVQAALIRPVALPAGTAAEPPRPAPSQVAALADALAVAERPVFIAGRGARHAAAEITALSERSGALLATSAVCRGLFRDHPFSLDVSGGFASPVAAELIGGADLVIAWGCSLTMWTTRHGRLIGGAATVAQVDADPAALGVNHRIDLGVVGDVAATARAVSAELARRSAGPAAPVTVAPVTAAPGDGADGGAAAGSVTAVVGGAAAGSGTVAGSVTAAIDGVGAGSGTVAGSVTAAIDGVGAGSGTVAGSVTAAIDGAAVGSGTVAGSGATQRRGYRSPQVAQRLAREGRWRDVPFEPERETGRIDPRTLSIALDDLLPAERTVAVDSGNFMGYPTMFLDVPDADGSVFTQAFQSVGLGLSTAIGAAIARPDRLTVAALGDGGALMGASELETAVRLGVNDLLVVVYDDEAYGAEVHHFGPHGHPLTHVVFPPADLARIAGGYGYAAVTVRGEEDLAAVRDWLAAPRTRPMLIDAKVTRSRPSWWLEGAFKGH